MTEDDLLSLVEQEEAQCISSTSGALAEQRRQAMAYYYGQPYGNEVEGRSQVVTTEVKDAVEGVMPNLMAIFTSSDEIVRFEPQNPGDEAAAQQATEYINYIFSRLNNGFQTLYCLFKDALLLKNGYVKVYWEDYQDEAKETYEDLSALEAAMMIQNNPDLEVVDYEVAETGDSYSRVVFKNGRKLGKICIDPIPPDEVLVSRETPNALTKARFVEHRTLKTLSDIRQMGYDVPDDIADFSGDDNIERVERLRYDDADANKDDAGLADPASRRVWFCEAYLHVDYDGDGIAEFRKVSKVGKTILDNEEFDSLPIIGGTAILMPHKHYGLSLADLVMDIQLIKSTITRQLLDNAYNVNNRQLEVLDGMVNMEDLLVSRPGGIKRVKAMGSIKPIDTPLLGAPFYSLLEYFDQMKQNRTGVRDFGNAVNPDALNAKAHTAELVRDFAAERINLMARVLAEGPVKELFWKILELVSKHQNKPQIVKLRDKWVEVDPREWKNKFNMTVTVGLGTGSQQQQVNGAMQILNTQAGMVQLGLGGRVVTEQNQFQAGRMLAKALFPKNADVLFTDPSTQPPPPPPPPDPKILVAQMQTEAAKQIQQMKDQADMVTQAQKKAFDAEKTQYREMMSKMAQERDLAAQAHQSMMDREQENRHKMVELVETLKARADKKEDDEQKILLQGLLRHFSEQAKSRQDHEEAIAERAVEASLTPKEPKQPRT
jgi:hypothetical protein